MKRFQMVFLLIAVLGLNGCKTTSHKMTTPYTEQDKIAAMDVYKDCIVSNVERLDDGTSDAYTVATAVAQLCRGQYSDVLEIQLAGENQYVYNTVMNRSMQNQPNLIVPMVLKMRK